MACYDAAVCLGIPGPHLFCPINHGVLNNPVKAPCGHLFCASCLAARLRKDPTCPICFATVSFEDVVIDEQASTEVAQLHVRCEHHTVNGCLWTGSLAELRRHRTEQDCGGQTPYDLLSLERKYKIPSPTLVPGSPQMSPTKIELLEQLKVKAKEAKRRHEAAVVQYAKSPEGSPRAPLSAAKDTQEEGASMSLDAPNNVATAPVDPMAEGCASDPYTLPPAAVQGPAKTTHSLHASSSKLSSKSKPPLKRPAEAPHHVAWLLIGLHKGLSQHKAYAITALAVTLAAVLCGLPTIPGGTIPGAKPPAPLTSFLMDPAKARSAPTSQNDDAESVPRPPHRASSVPGGPELHAGAQLEAAGSPLEAMGWYRKAALAGSPAAAVRMGAMVEAGMDVEGKHVEIPGRWYKLAAEGRLAQGQYELARWIGLTHYCRDLSWCEGESCASKAVASAPCSKSQMEMLMAHWWRKAAGQGHTGAQAALGQLLASGGGTDPGVSSKKRDMEALRWLKKASQAGNATAMVGLAAMLAEGRGGPRDESGAVRWLTRAAQLGSPHGQYNLGNMLFSGRGCTKDPALAAQWYRRAADQGHAQAQSNLGSMLAAGEGGTTNAQAAVDLFRKAARQGEATAQYNLGNMLVDGRGCVKDEHESAIWYKSAADQGYVRAQFAYAVMLSEGRGVGEANTAQAAVYYRHAAEKGLPEAQFNLGYLLATGSGTDKDEAAAARWFQRAGANGHANSLFNVGNMYYDGRGLPANATLALWWYRKAAAKGHGGAAYNAGVMLESGEVGEVDLEGALIYYTHAAERGMAQAQTALGIMLEAGKGCTKDIDASRLWFRKAAKQGHQGAITRLYSW